MNSIKWNNQLFFDMGIIIEKTPEITKSRRRITQYTVPGRNGFLSIDEGTYEPFSLVLECHYCDDNVDKDAINSWLDGYGTLTLDGEREYTGIVDSAISYEKVQMFKKFKVQFSLNPIAKKIEATELEVDLSEQSTSVDIVTEVDTHPIITLNATGNVSVKIGDTTFGIVDADGEYVLDCENKEITHNNINASASMSGNFPTLKKGTNDVFINGEGTIESMTITYHEAYL